MRRRRLLPILLVSAGLAFGRASPARAAGLEVSPVVVELSRDARNSSITLKNAGTQPVRYQLSLFAWAQTPAGEMKLEPTDDIAFFPPIVSLGPAEERVVRIGAAIPSGRVEKSYRLFIEEMPPPRTASTPPGVRVIARIGIPIFVAPQVASLPRGEIAGLALERGRVLFQVRNTGAIRFRPVAVQLRALDGSGQAILDRRLDSWYVLAGGERAYEVAMPRDTCEAIRNVSVEVSTERDALRSKLFTPGGACGP